MEADSGLYTCQLVGEDTVGGRDKKVGKKRKEEEEETRAELEINVFRREKETEEKVKEGKEEGENWKVVHGGKKEDTAEDVSDRTEKEGFRKGEGAHLSEKKEDTEDMSERNEEEGFREGAAHLSESDRGGGTSSSRVIFQKFQTTDQFKGDSGGDIQKEVESRTESTRNLIEPSLKSYRNVTKLSLLSSGTKTDAVAQDDLSSRPTLSTTSSGEISWGKSYVLVSLCSVVCRILTNNPM